MWMKLTFTRYHVAMFLLTFICFALYHASRKAFSNIKDSLSKEWSPVPCNCTWPCPHPHKPWDSHQLFPNYKAAEPFLGLLDTAFLFSYAVGLYVSGILGDRYELRLVLAIGMWLSSLVIFLFGTLSQWIGLYNKAFYLVMWALNGLVQSSGWPCVIGIVGNWFGKSGRGFIFGIWSSCSSVGNILGSLFSGALINYGYEVVFFNASLTMLAGGFLAFFGIINTPIEVGLEDPNSYREVYTTEVDTGVPDSTSSSESEATESTRLISNSSSNKTEPIGFIKALLLPGVITYALVFAAIKMINYSLLFWLPYYLTNNFGWSDTAAANISVLYDVGSIIGGITFGLISDLSGKRSPVLLLMLLFSPLVLWGYQASPPDQSVNGGLLLLVGIFVGGASNIVGTAVTTDVGKQEAIGNDVDALSTVTGIIDGTGSIGAAVGQVILPYIQASAGWKWVFYSFMIECVFVMVCLLPALIEELRTWGPFIRLRNGWNFVCANSISDEAISSCQN